MLFYLYGNSDIDITAPSAFDFTVATKTPVHLPACLLLDWENDETAVLGKIRTVKPARYGMVISVCGIREIKINLNTLINSVFPPAPLPEGEPHYSDARQLIRNWYDSLVECPADKSELIINTIVKRNKSIVDRSYFQHERPNSAGTSLLNEEIGCQVSDALSSALMFFGNREFLSQVTEEGFLDFDIDTLFDNKKLVLQDGKHCFRHNGKRLYLHKVHRLTIEQCLGVDLIYNFMDERRAVFVQYKCTRDNGRFYHRGDETFASEMARMKRIPGIDGCTNFAEEAVEAQRLCRCPVFVKLCHKGRPPEGRRLSRGVYFPVCVFDKLCQRSRPASITIRDHPHFTNESFQELVRGAFIGSTACQSDAINKHLVAHTKDERLKLIFDETADS